MIKFGIDKQTLLDLNIFPQANGDFSVFEYYNHTQTKGGKEALEEMMRMPLNNRNEIEARISIIRYITEQHITVNVDKEHLAFVEHYLGLNIPVLKNKPFGTISLNISNKIRPNNDIYIISKGLEYLKIHLGILTDFLSKFSSENAPSIFIQLKNELVELNKIPEFAHFLKSKGQHFSIGDLIRYDPLIRKNQKENIKRILELTYFLDAYISIARTAEKNKLGFPVILESEKPIVKIKDVFHPFIKNPVPNDVTSIDNKNLCFVTGANMAGKSTFLKSIGLCIYLSHLGFPVPANAMETAVFNGLYTTINISDNINQGYSHYYSEVKRVKEIALMLKEKAFCNF